MPISNLTKSFLKPAWMIWKNLSYPTGQSLKFALSEETYQKLSRYCTEKTIPIEELLPFKSSMVSMILFITELQQLGFTGLGALETIEQQLNFITEMGKGK